MNRIQYLAASILRHEYICQRMNRAPGTSWIRKMILDKAKECERRPAYRLHKEQRSLLELIEKEKWHAQKLTRFY